MALNSLLFVLFLSAVCLVSYMMPRKVRYIWLLLCSYAFYLYSSADMPGEFSFTATFDWAGLWGGAPKLGLLVGSTLFSFLGGLGMGKTQKIWLRRLLLILCLAQLLGVLCLFKYADFTLVYGGRVLRFNPVLPLGLSYYTLQAVGYLAEVYTGGMAPEKNPVRYALFVSFFPGIVLGPINRAKEMLPQYKNPAPFSYDRVAGGLFRVLWGIFKKVVIAGGLEAFTYGIFSTPSVHSGPMLVLGALLFCYQLYADFGGCCDIAIGAARMLGFTFMENFERPFAAKTYSGLWQRWHISLTSFFRDYVFTPLVWSRWTEKLPVLGKWVKKPPMLSSTLLIFLLSGIWHGASWHFALWGLANGLIMAGCQLFGKKKEKLAARVPVYRMRHLRGFVQRVLVYLMFAGCLVFFAAGMYDTPLAAWFARLPIGWPQLADPAAMLARVNGAGLSTITLVVLALSILTIESIEKFGVAAGKTMADWIRARWFFVRWPLYYLLLAAMLAFGAFGQSAFIYGQF